MAKSDLKYCYRWPRPGYTADCVILRPAKKSNFEVLLIQRGGEPFKGSWALPGGFVNEYEALPDAAARELQEETGLTDVKLKFVDIYGEEGRDPRGWTVTGAFWGFLPKGQKPKAGDDAANFGWFPVDNLPSVAFDHAKVIADAMKKMKRSTRPATRPSVD
ncbi:MAG: NUDIX hydrolase, partial [Thermoguttaceae bacterium]|nr:NUDIX hydrolase [Thermoguttaceae bacterium]